jgi:DNA-binding MarR family transcriptional regulator
MVDLIDRLEAAGFVERQPDPNDRRARLIQLTPRGRQVLKEGIAASDEVEAKFLTALSAAEQKNFRKALASLI